MGLVLKAKSKWAPKISKERKGLDKDRRFDKTQLHEDHHGQAVHRDYAAHFFRWGFASNYSGPGKRILEIGCGQDQPFLRVLQASIGLVPQSYVGVDLNTIKNKRKSKWGVIRDEFNFIDQYKELVELDESGDGYNLVICFEVIEHMGKDDGRKLLTSAKKLMSDDAKFLLSTPVYNLRKMAANHIHEYEEAELKELIEECGLKVLKQFGTFASWNDLKKVISKQERALVEELNQYYSHDVLSCFLAPKYPLASRNIIWELAKA